MLIRYCRRGRTALPNASISCRKVTTLRSLVVRLVSSNLTCELHMEAGLGLGSASDLHSCRPSNLNEARTPTCIARWRVPPCMSQILPKRKHCSDDRYMVK